MSVWHSFRFKKKKIVMSLLWGLGMSHRAGTEAVSVLAFFSIHTTLASNRRLDPITAVMRVRHILQNLYGHSWHPVYTDDDG